MPIGVRLFSSHEIMLIYISGDSGISFYYLNTALNWGNTIYGYYKGISSAAICLAVRNSTQISVFFSVFYMSHCFFNRCLISGFTNISAVSMAYDWRCDFNWRGNSHENGWCVNDGLAVCWLVCIRQLVAIYFFYPDFRHLSSSQNYLFYVYIFQFQQSVAFHSIVSSSRVPERFCPELFSHMNKVSTIHIYLAAFSSCHYLLYGSV